MLGLWLMPTVALWVFSILGLWEIRKETDADRRLHGRVAFLLAAVPPTLIFSVSAFVLLQAAPTVQFNFGSSWAMRLWSFWVHSWANIFGCATMQALAYLCWVVATLVTKPRPWLRPAVGCALVSSSFGWLLLSVAHPRA